jgi:hypothetical protein
VLDTSSTCRQAGRASGSVGVGDAGLELKRRGGGWLAGWRRLRSGAGRYYTVHSTSAASMGRVIAAPGRDMPFRAVERGSQMKVGHYGGNSTGRMQIGNDCYVGLGPPHCLVDSAESRGTVGCVQEFVIYTRSKPHTHNNTRHGRKNEPSAISVRIASTKNNTWIFSHCTNFYH